jgi:Zn finger protein HypA/HybF involved in hydrogenase expression
MLKRLTIEEFITKAIFVHGEGKYDYSKVDYINSNTKVVIICSIHGEFKQAPDNHLHRRGCPKCKSDKQRLRKSYSIADFIEKAKKVHGYKYDYSKVDYINSRSNIIIICPIHGEFKQNPASHLHGQGCPKCKSDKQRLKKSYSIADFIQKSSIVHGERKYDYSKVDYINSRSNVIIICPIHGEFEQRPSNHLFGRGCLKCKGENQRNINGIRWVDKYKESLCILYFLKCYNDEEEFLKIGITSQTIDKRYPSEKSMPYHRIILYQYIGTAQNVWNMEEKIKYLFKIYNPRKKFKGSKTEALHISQETAILEFLQYNS